jgi:hypothetical protein
MCDCYEEELQVLEEKTEEPVEVPTQVAPLVITQQRKKSVK